MDGWMNGWMDWVQDNRFGLLLVLPNRYDGLNELESKLNVNNYTASYFMRKMIHRDVDVTLPRFRIQYGLEMANIFKQVICASVSQCSGDSLS